MGRVLVCACLAQWGLLKGGVPLFVPLPDESLGSPVPVQVRGRGSAGLGRGQEVSDQGVSSLLFPEGWGRGCS